MKMKLQLSMDQMKLSSFGPALNICELQSIRSLYPKTYLEACENNARILPIDLPRSVSEVFELLGKYRLKLNTIDAKNSHQIDLFVCQFIKEEFMDIDKSEQRLHYFVFVQIERNSVHAVSEIGLQLTSPFNLQSWLFKKTLRLAIKRLFGPRNNLHSGAHNLKHECFNTATAYVNRIETMYPQIRVQPSNYILMNGTGNEKLIKIVQNLLGGEVPVFDKTYNPSISSQCPKVTIILENSLVGNQLASMANIAQNFVRPAGQEYEMEIAVVSFYNNRSAAYPLPSSWKIQICYTDRRAQTT